MGNQRFAAHHVRRWYEKCRVFGDSSPSFHSRLGHKNVVAGVESLDGESVFEA